jgi:hypothetical protein
MALPRWCFNVLSDLIRLAALASRPWTRSGFNLEFADLVLAELID